MSNPPSTATYLLASNAVYNPNNSLTGTGLTALTDTNGNPITMQTSNGLVAAAYMDSNGNVIISYQGTNLGNTDTLPAQLAADLKVGAGQNPQSFTDALNFADTVADAAAAQGIPQSNIYVTGHSLGGIEAEYVAMQDGYGGASFGATGLPNYDGSVANTGFTNYVNYGDPVGNFSTDSAESSVAGEDQYHYGDTVYQGNPVAGAVLQLNAEDLANNPIVPVSGSLALATLGADLSNHYVTSYASNLGVTLPPSGPAVDLSSSDALASLIVPLGGEGREDVTDASVSSNGTITTPDFTIQENSSGGFIVTQNQTLSAVSDTTFNVPLVTTVDVDSTTGEVTSLSDASMSGTALDRLVNNYATDTSTLTDYVGQASSVASNMVMFNELGEQGIDLSQALTMTDGSVDQFSFDASSDTASAIATVDNDGEITAVADNVTVSLATNSSFFADGDGDIVDGTSEDLVAFGTSGSDTVDATLTIAGTGVQVDANATYQSIDLTSGGETATIYAADEYVTGADDTVADSGNQTYTVAGSGNTVDLGGDSTLYDDASGDSVTGSSGNLVAFGATGSSSADVDLTVNGSGMQVDANAAYQSVDLTGSGDTATIYATDEFISGSDDTIADSGNENYTVAGTDDAVNLDGGSLVFIDDAEDTVTGASGNTVAFGDAGSSDGDVDLTVGGDGVQVDANAAYQSIDLTGSSDTATVYATDVSFSGTSDTLSAIGGVSFTVSGNDDTIDSGNGDTTGVQGQSDLVTASSGVVNVDGDTDAAVSGSNDTIYAADGDTVGIQGTSDLVGENDGVVNIDDGSNVSIDGSGDTIYGANNDTIGVGGSNDLIGENDGVVNVDDGSNVSITGSGDTVYSAQGNTVGIGGTGDLVGESDGVVNVDDDSSATVDGNDNTIYTADGDNVGIAGTGDLVGEVDGVVNIDDNSSATVNGDGNTIYCANGDTVGVEGTDELVGVTDGAVDLDDGTRATISGSDDTINGASGDTVVLDANDDGNTISASDITVNIGSSVDVTIDGNGDTLVGATDDSVTVTGDDDSFSGNDSNIDYDGSDTSGDTVTGSDDTGSGYAPPPPPPAPPPPAPPPPAPPPPAPPPPAPPPGFSYFGLRALYSTAGNTMTAASRSGGAHPTRSGGSTASMAAFTTGTGSTAAVASSASTGTPSSSAHGAIDRAVALMMHAVAGFAPSSSIESSSSTREEVASSTVAVSAVQPHAHPS